MVEEKKKWKREISAGGLVYKREKGKIFVLLILKKPWRRNDKKDIWTYPKGRIDGEEKLEETAVREVREEAGVVGQIEEKLGSVKFTFTWEGENIFKIVTYYLMKYVSGDPSGHDYEVAEAKWFELSEAEKFLTYKADKETFEKARSILNLIQDPLQN